MSEQIEVLKDVLTSDLFVHSDIDGLASALATKSAAEVLQVEKVKSAAEGTEFDEVAATQQRAKALGQLFDSPRGAMLAAAPLLKVAASARMKHNEEADAEAVLAVRTKFASENADATEEQLDEMTKQATLSVYMDEASSKLMCLQQALSYA